MRKIAALCTMFLATTFMATAQEAKKEAPKSPAATAKNSMAEVSYSQPSKKGRVIFGDLVPYGEVWRTGANMSTDVTFKTDVMISGKEIKKGTYAIFTVPQETEWKVILNSKPKQKGASEYEANKDKNVLEVNVPVEKTKTIQETFLITLDKGNIIFAWDDVKVKLPVVKK